MLEWLKNTVAAGKQQISNARAAGELQAQFAPIGKLPGAPSCIVDRLVRYVLIGQGEGVVVELAALQGTCQALDMSATHYGGGRPRLAASLSTLITLLPENADLYLRLAIIYEAALQAGSGARFYTAYVSIPTFHGSLSWLSAFLVELSGSRPKEEAFFPASLVQAMLVAKDEDPSLLVRGALHYEDAQGKSVVSRWYRRPYSYFQCLRDFPNIVLASPEIVQQSFRQKDAGSRACVLQSLQALKIRLEPFAESIAALSVSGSKEVREKAEQLVATRFEVVRSHLHRLAETGSSDERFHAVRLLARAAETEERTYLTGRLEVEKSAKVVDALKELLSGTTSAGASESVTAEDFNLSPVADIPVRRPLDQEVLADLRNCIDEFDKRAAEEFARNKYAQAQKKTRTPVASGTAKKLFEALQDFVVAEGATWQYLEPFYWGGAQQILDRFGAHPKFELIHLVRWCLLISGRNNNQRADWRRWFLGYWSRGALLAYQKARRKPIDLRQLAAVFRAVGLDDRTIGENLLNQGRWAKTPLLLSDPNVVWPYFAERPDLFEEALGLRHAQEQPNFLFQEKDRRQTAFSMLKLFPRLPAKLVPLLWDLALGPGKTERGPAQECLDRIPGKEEKIIAALASRQQDARLAAAEWLAKLKHKPAIPALRAALAKEKSEIVKDELIKALETLEVSLEELLDLDRLDQDAEKGLKKEISSDLQWFPFEQLPGVHWADSGEPVSPLILKWFLVQSHRLNNPEANPSLRRYCSLFRKDDREKLGMFVLEAWIAKDTKPKNTAEQAAALAQKEAQQYAAYAKQNPKYYPDFDEQRLYQTLFNRYLVQPEGSQTSTKGILAVAGASCGGAAAPIVHRYIKQWYGYRPAQSKALLQVLAWADHPSATQVVLSVANRFRTKGIQEEAMRQCQLLAERKGWTLDELADRTIPTAGLDEDGAMELDYGARKFTARLSEEMTLTLTNQAEKTIASLPDANQSDDADKVKQAKALLSASRKELKSVLSMQKERLYEALCTQRFWRFEDWDTYLRKHPIVGRYCQRLVWVVCAENKVKSSFRPLSDGTLTDHNDEEVSLDAMATIRLAHNEVLGLEDRNAWLGHFSDYKVEPLIQQFGKPAFALKEQDRETTEIKEFLGHIVKAFSLRNRLTRLGYTRGAAQDGGWFFDYRKNFPGLGIEAVIEFTGNGLPEENRTVALQRLYFSRKNVDGGTSIAEELSLGELPPVLLSECWNDMRMAAAEGSGYAADWQQQTEY
jgi:Domain of unknown function (DUF4132)